jgi:hypothetical protein
VAFLAVFIVVLISAMWIGVDASRLGFRRVKNPRFLDMGPVGWMFSVLLCWIIAFPAYLFALSRFIREHPLRLQQPAPPLPVTPSG